MYKPNNFRSKIHRLFKSWITKHNQQQKKMMSNPRKKDYFSNWRKSLEKINYVKKTTAPSRKNVMLYTWKILQTSIEAKNWKKNNKKCNFKIKVVFWFCSAVIFFSFFRCNVCKVKIMVEMVFVLWAIFQCFYDNL